jgi:hypothetical protein
MDQGLKNQNRGDAVDQKFERCVSVPSVFVAIAYFLLQFSSSPPSSASASAFASDCCGLPILLSSQSIQQHSHHSSNATLLQLL